MIKKGLFLLLLTLLHPPRVQAAVELSGNFAFGSIQSFGELISYLVPTAFIIGGIILAFFFFTAAFDMIISQGDKNAVSAAREKIVHAIIGFVLLILSFVIVRYLPYFLFGEQPFWFF